jgi:SPW repeat
MAERSAYTSMADHPDVVEMRARYERVSGSPQAVITDDLLLLAGLWLAISPWVLQFHGSTPNVAQSNLIVGIAVAAMGLGMAILPRAMQSLSWATFLIGAWVVVSPWVIQRSSVPVGTYLSNVITGGVIALLGLAGAGIAITARRGLLSARH